MLNSQGFFALHEVGPCVLLASTASFVYFQHAWAASSAGRSLALCWVQVSIVNCSIASPNHCIECLSEWIVVSVWRQSFARACHIANSNKSSQTMSSWGAVILWKQGWNTERTLWVVHLDMSTKYLPEGDLQSHGQLVFSLHVHLHRNAKQSFFQRELCGNIYQVWEKSMLEQGRWCTDHSISGLSHPLEYRVSI